MTNAELIAGLAGPVLIAVAVAILVNRAAMADVLKDIASSPSHIFIAGILTLLAGLAIVRTHNVWSAEWTILVTVIGWLAIIGGAARIIFPDRIATMSAGFLANENALTASALVALLLGAFLTAKGFAFA